MKEKRDSNEAGPRIENSRWFIGFATVFGIFTWVAAAGKFIDLVWFVQVFTENWRQFFRDLWKAVSDFVHLPYEFTPNQKDSLTLIVACCAIGLRPSIFGFDSKPLFKQSINMFEMRNLKGSPTAWFWKSMFAAFISILFVTPFIDMNYFERDVMALTISGIFLWFTVVWVRTVAFFVRSKFDAKATYTRFDPLPGGGEGEDMWERDFMSRWVSKPIIFVCTMISPPILAASFFDDQFRGIIFDYLLTYSAVNFVNIVIFWGIFGALFFAVRKSIRPVANIVVMGVLVLFVASSANTLIESYERNFPKRALTPSSATVE